MEAEIHKRSKSSIAGIWKYVFAVKLAFNLALTGVFFLDHSLTGFWRFSFVLLSVGLFLFLNSFYINSNYKQNWLLPVLLIDFLVSASYGYVFISGDYPNHLFIGITALAILMFLKSTRAIVVSCLGLLLVYLAMMVSVDRYVYGSLDPSGYFISCSLIVFAGIVSVLLHSHARARRDTEQLYAQLMESHRQLQDYALKTEEWAASRERVRIARDIHDTVGHKLTALLVQMQAGRKLGKLDPPRSEQIYLECEELVRSSLQEVRLSVRAIREQPASSTSLNESLGKLSEEFTKLAEVQTVLEVNGEPVALPGTLQLTAYRIVQESLTNAHRHGHAKNARILLDYSDSGLSLSIRNDGAPPAELKPGFGLINLRERVREWNGDLRFDTDPNKDFAVEVQFPYARIEMERV